MLIPAIALNPTGPGPDGGVQSDTGGVMAVWFAVTVASGKRLLGFGSVMQATSGATAKSQSTDGVLEVNLTVRFVPSGVPIAQGRLQLWLQNDQVPPINTIASYVIGFAQLDAIIPDVPYLQVVFELSDAIAYNMNGPLSMAYLIVED